MISKMIIAGILSSACILGSYADELKIAWVTDAHVVPNQEQQATLGKAIAEINAMNDVELVIVSGDIVNLGTTYELLAAKSEFDKLTKPMLIIPGNHETNWSDNAIQSFAELWGDDKFVYHHKNYLFIGISSGPYLKMGDGIVKSEDLQWLKDTLASEYKEGEEVIFVSHIPLNKDLSNAQEVLSILDDYPVRLTLAGHYHAYYKMNFRGIPGFVGRSVVMKVDGDVTKGYNILEIDDNQTQLFNKLIDEDIPTEALYTIVKDDPSTYGIIVPYRVPVDSLPPEELTLYKDAGFSIFGTVVMIDDELVLPDNPNGRYGNVMGWQDVAIYGLNDSITAINKDGSERWSIKTTAPVTCVGKVVDDVLYMGLGRESFAAINPDSGEIIWQFNGAKGAFQGMPAVKGDIVAFGAWDTNFYVVDRNSGELKWSWNNGNGNNAFSPGNVTPVIGDKNIAIVAPDRFLTIFDIVTGEEILRTNEYRFRESFGSSADGKFGYAKTMDGELVVVDIDNAKIVKVIDSRIGYEHNPCMPVIAFDSLFLTGRQGDLVRIDLESGEVMWSFRCGQSGFNQLYVAPDGNLYGVMLEGKIFKISR